MKLRTLLTKLLPPTSTEGHLIGSHFTASLPPIRMQALSIAATLTLSGCSLVPIDYGMQPGSYRDPSSEKEPTLEELDQTLQLDEIKDGKLLATLNDDKLREIKDDKSLTVLNPDKALVKVEPQAEEQNALVVFDSKKELTEHEKQEMVIADEQAVVYNAKESYMNSTLALNEDFQKSLLLGQKKGQEMIVKSMRKFESMIDQCDSMDDFDAEKIKENMLALMATDTDHVLNAYLNRAKNETKIAESFSETIDKLAQAVEKVYETWEKGHDKILKQQEKQLDLEERRFYKALEANEKKKDKEIALAEKKHSKECDKLDKEFERNCKKWDAAFERFCKKEENALLIQAKRDELELEKQEEQNRINQEKKKSQQLLLQHKNKVEAENAQQINEEKERHTEETNRIELKKSEELLKQEIQKNAAVMDIEIKKAELLEKQDAKVKEEFDKQMKLYEQEVAIGYEFVKDQMRKNRGYRFTNNPPKIVEEGGKKVVKPGVVSWSAS